VAVGRGENSVFELLQELARSFPELRVEPVIADVRDRARLERVFRAYRPSTVFHAAAHKHVPLMEQNVSEAILNNVLGTQVVAELAARFGAERFVLISSDKAVRPSSVMGATKRLAEGVIQALGALVVPLRVGALRQRARQPRQRDPHLPAPDPARAGR
jgi:FlaA1/EpsC-like NDP-sugar epimerase